MDFNIIYVLSFSVNFNSQWVPLWDLLTSDAREKVKKGNFKRLFDAARIKVRTWEKAEMDADAIAHQNR